MRSPSAVWSMPNRAMSQEHLAKAEKAIREGEALIEKQRDVLAKLQADGQDISEAKRLLENMLVSQAAHEEHRKMILKELGIES